jgi:hypothetical protein
MYAQSDIYVDTPTKSAKLPFMMDGSSAEIRTKYPQNPKKKLDPLYRAGLVLDLMTVRRLQTDYVKTYHYVFPQFLQNVNISVKCVILFVSYRRIHCETNGIFLATCTCLQQESAV